MLEFREIFSGFIGFGESTFEKMRMLKTFTNPIFVFLSLFSAFSLVYIAALSLKLRPISDDYCFGSVTANYGFWGGLNFWFTNWSGDYSSLFSSTLFIGIPLSNFPFALASGATFLIAAALLGIIAFLLYGIIEGSKSLISLTGALLALMSPTLWLVFWWSTSLASMDEFNLEGPRSIIHWQNINSGYVIPLALALIWVLLLLRFKVKSKFSLVFSGIGIGAWVGGSGLVLSLFGVVVALALMITSLAYPRLGVPRNYFWLAGPWFLANTIGWLVSFTSPGTQGRRGVISAVDPSIDNRSFADFVDLIFPSSIIEWVELLVAPGTILVFVIVFALGTLLETSTDKDVDRSGFKWSGILLFLSLFLNIVSQAASVFSSDAFWHTTPSALLLFVSITVFALTFGRVSQTWMSAYNIWPRSLILLATVLVSIGVLNSAFVDASERRLLWETGPAQFVGMADIGGGGYVDQCWGDLGKFRDTPDRRP